VHSVYNIGSGRGATVNDVLTLAREVTGRDILVQQKPRPVTYVERSVLDVGRFTEEFGARASVSLREGLERTWHAILAEQCA
jgi:UDP-glucose 4-epimerase